MGWKCALLYASEREPGYLGTLPQHLPEKATELKIALGMPDLRSEGMEILESAIHPDTQFLFLGAYDRTFLITDWDIAESCMIKAVPGAFSKIRALLPDAWGMALMLHSGDNVWGYSLYEEGASVRLRCGSNSDGVTQDFGIVQPEEETLFARSVIEKGKRLYKWQGGPELLTEDQVGEEFVFELSRRLFGGRFDSAEECWELKLEQFRKPKKDVQPAIAKPVVHEKRRGFWSRLFGGK